MLLLSQWRVVCRGTPTASVRWQRLTALLVACTQVNSALHLYGVLLDQNQRNVNALLGQARCYVRLNASQRARQHLRLIEKMPWSAADADDFERAWLLLAHIYIQSGKPENASELLTEVLNKNRCVCVCICVLCLCMYM